MTSLCCRYYALYSRFVFAPNVLNIDNNWLNRIYFVPRFFSLTCHSFSKAKKQAASTLPGVNLTHRFICDKIRSCGPITLHEYMQLCLGSAAGYYSQGAKKKEIFGKNGDFVTSPEISQMFGELIGVWIANEIKNTGFKNRWQLVELGAGSGVLMRDIIAALSKMKVKNFDIHIVEVSDALIERQQQTLCGRTAAEVKKILSNKSKSKLDTEEKPLTMTTFTKNPVYWHRLLNDIPKKFTVFIGNEFLDVLPIHQFWRASEKEGSHNWHETYVNLDENNKLCLMLSKSENVHTKGLIPDSIRNDLPRTQWEVCPMAADILGQIIHRFTETGGFALFIDYGHDGSRLTSSLRAYKKHALVDALLDPGEVDVTADVDFGYLREVLAPLSLVFGPVSQRNFLFELGITKRVFYLMSKCKTDKEREYLHNSFKILMDDTVEDKNEPIIKLEMPKEQLNGMGTAFKMFALFPKTLHKIMEKRGGTPAGFQSALHNKFKKS